MNESDLLPDPLLFDWDGGNSEKNRQRHDVGRLECEEMFLERPLLVAADLPHSAQEPRYLALGQTRTGRRLFVSFTIREGRVRIISARDMSRGERRQYENARKEGLSEANPDFSH